MLVNTTTTTTSSSAPTPGSSSSTSNTLEPSPQTLPSANNSRPPSRAPSILDSPTLARVERARLRLEASSHQQLHHQYNSCGIGGGGSGSGGGGGSNGNSIATTMNREDSLERSILDPKQSLLAGRIPVASMTGPIKRGLLWQQRDRLFSRWKERYIMLTRKYLHIFKKITSIKKLYLYFLHFFLFQVKLVDVEKVEWLNRRSYSAIGLLLGREGRVLLRCDDGLEDWYELLEECTLTSKERRRALKIAQGPRSRASLAAPVSHASLQNHHFGLGGTYSSAFDDWLMTSGSGAGRLKLGTGSVSGFAGNNPFLFSDSVPDLSALNNKNQNHISGMSTNHSTPQKIPYSSANNANLSRYSNGYSPQNSSFSNCTGLYGSPRRIFINSSFGSNHVVDEEAEDGEVLLRRPRISRNNNTENGNELDRDWLYRKPRAPTDMRHSVQPMLSTSTNGNGINNANHSHQADLDYSAHDSGLDTSSSTHRPSSYRRQGF
ncbi:uncharacterized protein LOC119687982 [Teleopsis dalmanni]|uniref:uncharacterized protein LOC119687982 n=1 Tax=Teleopsis dalmanni TaxID=139649 RepID=UPI0018CF6FB2|nr:uncharacterized protein LOC119687982 [Teleopsis dalmanni]